MEILRRAGISGVFVFSGALLPVAVAWHCLRKIAAPIGNEISGGIPIWKLVAFFSLFIGPKLIFYTFPGKSIHRDPFHEAAVTSDLMALREACMAYWADEGASAQCNLDAARSDYGFIQTRGVVIENEGGAENNFTAIGYYKNSQRKFFINAQGRVDICTQCQAKDK